MLFFRKICRVTVCIITVTIDLLAHKVIYVSLYLRLLTVFTIVATLFKGQRKLIITEGIIKISIKPLEQRDSKFKQPDA